MVITSFQIQNRVASYLLLPVALIMTLVGMLIYGLMLLLTLPAVATASVDMVFPDTVTPNVALCYGFPLFAITIIALPSKHYHFGPMHRAWLSIQPKPSHFLRLKARSISKPWELCKQSLAILRHYVHFNNARIITDFQFTNPIQAYITTLILSIVESWIPSSRIHTDFFCCHRYQLPQSNIKLNLQCECRCRLLPMLFALYRQLKKHTE